MIIRVASSGSGSSGGALYSGFTPTIYAAPTDQGTGDGSSEANAMDLVTALTVAVAGDVIGYLPGTYAKSVGAENTWQPLFRPTNSGTSSNPIRIVAKYPARYLTEPVASNSNRSEFVVTGATPGTTDTHPVLGNGENHDHIQWWGFYVDQDDAPAYPSKGTCQASQGSEGIAFREFYIRQRFHASNDNFSCFFCEDSDDLVIRNFKIAGPFGIDGGHNVTCGTLYGCKNFYIGHGYHDGVSTGWFVKGSNTNGGEVAPYNYGMLEYHWFDDAAVTCFTVNEVQPTGSRCTIRHVVAVGCAELVMLDDSTGSPSPAPWNTLTKNLYVYQNTIVDPTNSVGGSFWAGGMRGDHQIDDGQFYNNIIAYTVNPGQQTYHINLGGGEPNPTEPSDTVGFSTLDYNCYYMAAGTNRWVTNGTTYTSFASWQSAVQADVAGQESHSITSNPSFVDAANGDYRLNGGSPCAGTGLGGANMGAYLAGMAVDDVGPE